MSSTQNFALTATSLSAVTQKMGARAAVKDVGRTGAEVPPEIRRAADGFESLFVAQLLEPLEKSSEAMFGSGPEGRTISGLYREQLSNSISKSRPLGVATLIEKELLARQASRVELNADLSPAKPKLASSGLAQHE